MPHEAPADTREREAELRKQRLASALRENLRRRKVQAKGQAKEQAKGSATGRASGDNDPGEA